MKKSSAVSLMLIAAMFWGVSFSLIKNAEVNPFAFLFLRFFVAAGVLFFVGMISVRRLTKPAVLRALLLAVLLCAAMWLQNLALNFTAASNTAFIASLSAIIAPVLLAAFTRERVGKGVLLCAVCAMTGLFFLSGARVRFFNAGDVFALLSATFTSLHIIAADRFVRRGNALTLGIIQIIFSAFLSFILWRIYQPSGFSALIFDRELIIAVSVIGVFCTAFAFTAQIVAQQALSPSIVAIMLVFEPVFALIYALFIPAPDGSVETLTLRKALGAFLILSGAVSSLLITGRRGEKPK